MIVLRSALFAVWFYVGTFLVTFLGLPVLRLGQPRVLAYAQWWGRLMLAGLRRICRIEWEVTGLEHVPMDAPALLASMHQSAFDTLIWIALAPRFTYVFKKELSGIPIFGGYLLASGMIAVDRKAGGAAMRALLRDTDRAMADRRQIVIFPEGTRVAPGRRVDLQPGVAAIAARARLPVIPVVTNSGLFWGRNAFLKRPGTIRVAVQPPLPTGLPRDELMLRLAEVFAKAGDDLLPGAVDKSVSDASGRFA
jgi:1-acyl-sn-glycerol-3-phosphate acyltransferase